MGSCHSCGQPATRACTHCGRLCCEDHIDWAPSFPHEGWQAAAVCPACASAGWMAVKVILIGGAALVLVAVGYLFTLG